MKKSRFIYFSSLSLMSFTILIIFIIAIKVGSVPLPFSVVKEALTTIFFDENVNISHKVIIDLRLPRVLMALVVGAGLGMVGLLLQTITLNPLADPFLFGLSSGAASGAVLVITITGEIVGLWTLPLFAFLGSILAACFVLLLMKWQKNKQNNLVLTGLTTSFIFSAATNFMIFYGDHRSAHSILFWTLGGLGLAKWSNLWLPCLGFVAITLFLLFKHRQLDALLAGERTASSLGVNVTALRYQSFICAAFATGCFVSLVGVIGFVGLMVPHMIKIFSTPLHLPRIMTTALAGGLLLLASDVLARTLLLPQELPIGMITSALGALFMLILLRRL